MSKAVSKIFRKEEQVAPKSHYTINCVSKMLHNEKKKNSTFICNERIKEKDFGIAFFFSISRRRNDVTLFIYILFIQCYIK